MHLGTPCQTSWHVLSDSLRQQPLSDSTHMHCCCRTSHPAQQSASFEVRGLTECVQFCTQTASPSEGKLTSHRLSDETLSLSDTQNSTSSLGRASSFGRALAVRLSDGQTATVRREVGQPIYSGWLWRCHSNTNRRKRRKWVRKASDAYSVRSKLKSRLING